jgi:two-component system response regulator
MPVKSILLVEDNPDDEKLTLRALRKNGFTNIMVARDGVEAIEYLFPTDIGPSRDPPALPAFVLLDMKLPRMDGIAVLRRIRGDDRTRHLPVVMLTSSMEEQDLMRSYNHGANSYIRKPVDFIEFMEAVRQVGIYWLVTNEAMPYCTIALQGFAS